MRKLWWASEFAKNSDIIAGSLLENVAVSYPLLDKKPCGDWQKLKD
jgi:hypothetical protein